MKSIIKSFAAAAAIVLLAGCGNDYIDSLDGRYPAPEEYTLTSLVALNVDKQDGGKRLINVQLSGDAGALFNVTFVTNAYNLLPKGYTIAGAAQAVNGNYVAGISTFNGQAITAGVIDVTLSGESHYVIKGTLQLADNTFVRLGYEGDIVFPLDPPTVTYQVETSAPYYYTLDGATYLPLEGSKLSKVTVYSDDALAAYFEIVTADSKTSLAGTYPVSGSIADTNGAVVRGTYVDLPALGWGAEVIKGGSYLAADPIPDYLHGGTLTITESNGAVTFSSNDLTIIDISDPNTYGGTARPGTVSINLANATQASSYTYSNAVTSPYQYTQDGMNYTTIDGTQLNAITISSNGEVVAYFEVVTGVSPASLAGSYALSDPVTAAGQVVVGSYFDMSWFGGAGIMETGSYYMQDGQKQFIRAGGGALTIIDDGGVLGITGTGLALQDITQPMWATSAETGSVNFTDVQPE
ncbi:MAG: hypothetical protein LBN29_14385 [Mediterranea sp.]|jgi:hypothetical protein|nr:hypothetical protein [Mediterranea sp.]